MTSLVHIFTYSLLHIKNNVLYIICRHVHSLLPYQISHASSQPSVIFVTENSTKRMQSRHFAISISITAYTKLIFTVVHDVVAHRICTVNSMSHIS